MRRLILFRHGKSDWDADFDADHERPLSERGKRAATTMGVLLRDLGEAPDRIVSSTAVRAESTAELARISGGWSGPLELDEALYGASPVGALAVAAERGDDAERLMLVGHEPTWSMLAARLTGGSIVVRTGSIIGIDLSVDGWGDAQQARGTLAYALHPRLFERWAS
jgi:phosphohistidine phosphatase